MGQRVWNQLERLLTASGGWLLMLGGLTILGATVLMPAWLAWREVAWQREVMVQQVEQLARQHQHYQQFYKALNDDDPVLIQRLAYTQLRYKPADVTLLANPDPLDASISAYLAEPMPVVGVDIRPLPAMNTQLVRLTMGSHRWLFALSGLLCLLGGLWSTPKKPGQPSV